MNQLEVSGSVGENSVRNTWSTAASVQRRNDVALSSFQMVQEVQRGTGGFGRRPQEQTAFNEQ